MELYSAKMKRCIFFVMVVAEFLIASVPSLLAPFLPAEAEKKGVTPSQYGLIFAIDQVICLISAPIIGANLVKVGAKFVLCSGLLVVGVCCCLFGSLAWCPGPVAFLFLAYTIRIMEGFGTTCYENSSLSIITDLFRETANAKRSLLTSVFTLGMVVSPSIGGVLYYFGGFGLPFFTFGVLIIFGAAGLFFTLPNVETHRKSENRKVFKILLKSPLSWLAMFSLFTVAVTCSAYETTLEPHIRQFNFSPSYSSLFFVISPGVSAVVNVFSGSAIDKGFNPRKMMILASLLGILAYSVIGPLPFLPVTPTPYSVGVGLGVQGIGIALFFAAGFGELLRVAEHLGLELNQETNGVVTSLWQTNLSFGFFVGPIVSGVLLQYFGFRWGTLFPISINLILLFIVVPLVVRNGTTEKRHSLLIEEIVENMGS